MDDRALFDLGPSAQRRTTDRPRDLLDHQLDVGAPAFVVEDPDVFEAHQSAEDLTRVDDDEGASWLLAHTTSLKRLRLFLGDLRHGAPRQNPKSPKKGHTGHGPYLAGAVATTVRRCSRPLSPPSLERSQ